MNGRQRQLIEVVLLELCEWLVAADRMSAAAIAEVSAPAPASRDHGARNDQNSDG